MDDYRAILRRLALRDERYIESLLTDECSAGSKSDLGARAHALICLGALIALDAPPPSYMSSADAALRAGSSYDELVDALIAVLPIVGTARVVSAAPKLALAMGYDVGEGLESFENGDILG